MTIQPMISFKRFAVGLTLALSLFTAVWSSHSQTASGATPALPDELKKQSGGKMVLLDFYSDYCGTCRMMEPYLKALEAKTTANIRFERIDLADSGNEKYMNLYRIDGTPTYILYNQQGKPLYRMQDFITPLVLEKQVMRLSGHLKKMELPAGIGLPKAHQTATAQVGKDELDEMILVALENDDCQACREMSPYLQGFEMTGQKGLHILRMDSTTPAGKKLMADLSIKALPAYVLFDNNASGQEQTTQTTTDARGELFRMTGKIQPRLLWDVIRMFGDAGV